MPAKFLKAASCFSRIIGSSSWKASKRVNKRKEDIKKKDKITTRLTTVPPL
jgi:hypothetical protein